MMRTFILLLAFLSLASFKKQTTDEWVYEQEKKGIKVFTKKGKWGRLRDSKATMVVSTSPAQMLATLTNFDNYKEWFPRCSKSRLLARLGDNEYIVHLYFDAPWPVKNRDCVIRVKVNKDPKSGMIVISQTSEPKYVREEADVVRIQQIQSVWKLIPKNGGTEVINEYSSNPGGNIPDWMTNTQSVETPMVTFENLMHKTSTQK